MMARPEEFNRALEKAVGMLYKGSVSRANQDKHICRAAFNPLLPRRLEEDSRWMENRASG